jgi:DNA repair exonuclease SbcCD ATPase subunit
MLDPFKKGPGKPAEEHAAELQALVASSREERAALSTMLTQVQLQTSRLTAAGKSVQDLDTAVAKAHERADQVRNWLNQLQDATSALADDLRQMHDMSRLIRDDTAAVAAVAKQIEQRLGSLTEFQQLSSAADERLAALLALSEQAAGKMQALEEQAHKVDQAVDQSTRLNEMIWKMEGQISRLEEAEHRAKDTLVLVQQVEEASRQTAGRLEQGLSARDRLAADLETLEQTRGALADLIRREGEKVVLQQRRLAACDERLEALHGTVSALERRVGGIVESGRVKEVRAAAVSEEELHGRRIPQPPQPRHDDVAGVRSSALVEMLDDLRASVETLAARRGMTAVAATSCERLRDMAREAQSTIAALQSGGQAALRSSRGSRPAFSSGPLPATPSAPSQGASAPA